MSALSQERRDLLATRGLLAARVALPPRPAGDSFTWLRAPPEELPSDVTWFIDGSLFDTVCRASRRTGFGVAVVAASGDLLAWGCGVPPSWIQDASGAEAWAFFFVMREALEVPRATKDCMHILVTLEAGVAAATRASKQLARLWSVTASALDDTFELAASRTTWMPAHGAAHTIGVARDSRGQPITAVMWRANRLVDFLAKSAAAGQ